MMSAEEFIEPIETDSEPAVVSTWMSGIPVVVVAMVHAYGVLWGTVVVEARGMLMVPTLRVRREAEPMPKKESPATEKSAAGEEVPMPKLPPKNVATGPAPLWVTLSVGMEAVEEAKRPPWNHAGVV